MEDNSTKKYKITARVVDRESGAHVYENVRMIRVVSYDHNCLIMEDYMPIIGEVTRSVEIVMEDDTVTFAPIKGYYMHKKNEFYLLIENHEGGR